MWNSAHRACAPPRVLSRRDAEWLSANASNNLACTGVSAEPMRLSPYDAPGSADVSRTSGSAAPLARRLHDREAFFIFSSCTLENETHMNNNLIVFGTEKEPGHEHIDQIR